ncbi:hypothetical protein ACNKH9_06010 [Metapseudomonas otitidis]|uniref:hypothetical protein n=1 Tax=Pseudomonadaceae TaxID=135621 RepID=UPI0005DBF98F|nr:MULTISPECIES: hypothetical protein [Pseudomonas]KIV71922.1 hypothetical protein SZ55_2177 [Pseudomonas sp. FeS53a]WAF85545.1 hypothetical protein NRL37_26275 [Pseudomonas otitidis]
MPRFIGSLAIFGLLLGMMIGRLTEPEPTRLERIEVAEGGLVLWFNRTPRQTAEHRDGALAFVFEARAQSAQGRLQMAGRPVNWRLQMTPAGAVLHFVAMRPLKGEWQGASVDGQWRLSIDLHEG